MAIENGAAHICRIIYNCKVEAIKLAIQRLHTQDNQTDQTRHSWDFYDDIEDK